MLAKKTVIITFNTPTAAIIRAAGISNQFTLLVPESDSAMIIKYPTIAIPKHV